MTLKISRPALLKFIFLVIIVSFIHYILLKPVLLTGFETDDWGALLHIKSYTPNVLSQIFNLWTIVGTHHAGQYIYIGTLFNIFGFNYPIYNVVNIIFKTLATLSIFPVVFLIFKKRSLAFLTTIIYAISYSSTGALTYVLQGVYYLGIIFMNIFFIFYYLAVTKNSKIFLFFASLSLAIAYLLATGRIYPIFIFISLIEFFLNYRYGFKITIRKSILRLVTFYTPVFILMLMGKNNYSYLGSPSSTFHDLMNGNWHLLLTSFSALGYLFLPADYGKIPGYYSISSFGDYLNYLMGQYYLILIPLTLVLALILSKKILKFFLIILVINFILSLLVFLIAFNYTNVTKTLLAGYDPFIFWVQQYHALFGIYVLTVGIFCLSKWMQTKTEESRILLAAFIGPFFAFIFLIGMWVILGKGMDLYGGVNRYFPFASLGSSLFVAAIFSLAWDKASKKGSLSRGITQIFIIITLLFIFQISNKEIDITFRENNVRNSYLHKQFQENFINRLDMEKIRGKKALLFYFDMPSGKEKEYYERAFDLYSFRAWLYLRSGATSRKCIGVIVDQAKLKGAVQIKGGEKVFFPEGSSGCGSVLEEKNPDLNLMPENVIYKVEDFYAFRLENGKYINITDEILEKLQLK